VQSPLITVVGVFTQTVDDLHHVVAVFHLFDGPVDAGQQQIRQSFHRNSLLLPGLHDVLGDDLVAVVVLFDNRLEKVLAALDEISLQLQKPLLYTGLSYFL
jgi:hypothetical protein